MNTHIVDITLDNAQELIIDESAKRIVLVDFWADWCEPCKSLMPVLEKLSEEFGGDFLLAKINADDQQMLASQFGVRSLPTVMVVKDGQPIDGFAGLKSEQEVRDLLSKYLPKSWDKQHGLAKEHIEREEYELAYSLLRDASQASEQQVNIVLALAETSIKLKKFDEAETLLSGVKLVDQDSHYQQICAELTLAKEAKKAPELEALEELFSESPDNKEIALQLAVQYSQHGYHKEALVLLFDIVKSDLQFQSGEAKKTYLDILAVLGKGDPTAVEYQRKLYTLLY